MLTRRQFGLAAAAAVAAPYIQKAHANPAVIRIGMIQPFSGAYAAYAQEGQPAFNHVIRKINESGGIKSMGGAKIEIVLADDSSNPARTAVETRRLATSENVALVCGSILSAQMLAMTPVLDEVEIPAFSIWSAGTRSKWMYSTGFPYDLGYGKSMTDFVTWLRDERKFPLKTVVTAYSNYEAGQQSNKALTERLKAAGFQIIGDTPLDVKAQDQTAAMIRIRSQKPDLVMGLVTPRDGMLLHQARYNLNYHDSLFVGGTGGYADMSLWREIGPDIGKAVLTRNLFAMTGFSQDAKLPSIQAIVEELQRETKLHEIGQAAMQAAQAARIIQRVLEAAGSTDKKAIMEGFQKVEIPYGDPDLYLAKQGGIKFGDDRMLVDGSAMFIQWTDDRRQEAVFPTAFATKLPNSRI